GRGGACGGGATILVRHGERRHAGSSRWRARRGRRHVPGVELRPFRKLAPVAVRLHQAIDLRLVCGVVVLDRPQLDAVAGEIERGKDVELAAFGIQADIVDVLRRIAFAEQVVEGNCGEADGRMLATRRRMPVLLGITADARELVVLRAPERYLLAAGRRDATKMDARGSSGPQGLAMHRVGFDQDPGPAECLFQQIAVAPLDAVGGADVDEKTLAPETGPMQRPNVLPELRLGRPAPAKHVAHERKAFGADERIGAASYEVMRESL